MQAPIPIVFYTKRGCHLCEDVDEVLDMLAERHPLAVQYIDITQDAALYQRYWQRIPVLEIGTTHLEAPINRQMLQAAVLQTVREQSNVHE